MPIQSNEKRIVQDLIHTDFPHLKPYENDIISLVRKTFKTIGRIVWLQGKVLIKNFGTFEYLHRKARKRYDSGMKKTVITEPTDKIKYTQSRNVFVFDGDVLNDNNHENHETDVPQEN